MRRSLAGVGRDVENALERHIVASKAPRDLPHDGVADACAGAGFHEKGLEVALDIEQPLYEATTLLNAASLLNRCAEL